MDNYRICCKLEMFLPKIDCTTVTTQSPLFHCGSLSQNGLVTLLLWANSCLSILLNSSLFIWKLCAVVKDTKEKPHRVQTFFLWNLTVANLFMGIYLMIIALADLNYGNDFYIYSGEWWSSYTCRFSGFLSLLACEACVFFFLLISIDMYIRVKHMHTTEKRLTLKEGYYAASGAWFTAFVIAAAGAMGSSPDSEFYYLSDVCIGLPLIRRPAKFVIHEDDPGSPYGNQTIPLDVASGTKPAWALSILVFIILNMSCFIAAVILYKQNKGTVETLKKKWRKEREEEWEAEQKRREQEEALEQQELSDDDATVVDVADAEKSETKVENENEPIESETNTQQGSNEPMNQENATKVHETSSSVKLAIDNPDQERAIDVDELQNSQRMISRIGESLSGSFRQRSAKDNGGDVENTKGGPGADANRKGGSKKMKRLSRKGTKSMKRRQSRRSKPPPPRTDKNKPTEEGEQQNNEIPNELLNNDKINPSDTEADRSSETESHKGPIKKDGDVEQQDSASVAESEAEPYDKRTCSMFGKMKRLTYTAIFFWTPLFVLAILSQCGVDIPVISYIYVACLVVPMVSISVPIVIMFSTGHCFEQDIPDYIIDSEGEMRAITEMDVYEQTMMMMQL